MPPRNEVSRDCSHYGADSSDSTKSAPVLRTAGVFRSAAASARKFIRFRVAACISGRESSSATALCHDGSDSLPRARLQSRREKGGERSGEKGSKRPTGHNAGNAEMGQGREDSKEEQRGRDETYGSGVHETPRRGRYRPRRTIWEELEHSLELPLIYSAKQTKVNTYEKEPVEFTDQLAAELFATPSAGRRIAGTVLMGCTGRTCMPPAGGIRGLPGSRFRSKAFRWAEKREKGAHSKASRVFNLRPRNGDGTQTARKAIFTVRRSPVRWKAC